MKGILDFGFWILDFGFWILDFGLARGDFWGERLQLGGGRDALYGVSEDSLLLHIAVVMIRGWDFWRGLWRLILLS
jgi:hypothetical protein